MTKFKNRFQNTSDFVGAGAGCCRTTCIRTICGIPQHEDVREEEHREQENVDDSIKDLLSVGADAVTTLGQAPSKRNQEIQKRDPRGTARVRSTNASSGRRRTTNAPFMGPEVEESPQAEDEETPLVGTRSESTKQQRDEESGVVEQEREGLGEGDSSTKENKQEQQRCSEDPLYVTHEPNGSGASALVCELYQDRRGAKVGSLGEVRDAGDEQDSYGDIVEYTSVPRPGEVPEREEDQGQCMDGEGGP